MKKKVLIILSLLFIILFSIFLTITYTKNDALDRTIQHLDITKKETVINNVTYDLPIININVDEEIPGKPIKNPNGQGHIFTTSKTGETKVKGTMEITNSPYDDVKTDIMIGIRGASSRYFDKKGYSVRFIDDKNNNNAQSVLGMDSHHEWVLNGPFLDKTLIRNYLAYNIAGQIMDYSPNVRFCEVFLNGEYQGLYLMMENITAGNNARLDISVSKKNNSYSGYILRLDRENEDLSEDVNSFTRYTYKVGTYLGTIYPGKNNLTDTIKRNIELDFSAFEKSLYSYDFNDEEKGYRSKINVESFIDYFIINEISTNYDAGSLSTYIYKDKNGLYNMVVWDFNNAWDNYKEREITYDEGFEFQYNAWYYMMMKDEYFTNRLINRYKYLRENVLSDEYLLNFIKETNEYIAGGIQRNNARWPEMYTSYYSYLTLKSRTETSYEMALTKLQDYMINRLHWMDENIDSLAQYSSISKVKKFLHDAN